MRNRTRNYQSNQFFGQKSPLKDVSSLKLSSILNSSRYFEIIEHCREYRARIFSPFITLITFIKQVLDPDKSCRKAVSKVILEKLSEKEVSCTSNTGPYCKARQRLPEGMIKQLVEAIGEESNKQAPLNWKWKGREVKVADGTTLFMPDTKENQAVYPQNSSQACGLGFPSTRLLVIFSLTVGTILGYAMSAIRGQGTGEYSLLRQIMHLFNKGDILLADSCYPSFFLMAELVRKGCDGVFHTGSHRVIDFRKGLKLGKKDHVVAWKKPKKPDWMDEETYANYPELMRVRELAVKGEKYITTLLSHKKYHKDELSVLYGYRWQVELSLRNIKSTMRMEMLSCKTPEMVRKEVGVHLLAYNIIRIIMAEAGAKHYISPLRLSFKNTIQFINSMMPIVLRRSQSTCATLYEHVLLIISKTQVGNRPGRIEPKALKRRPRNYPLLMKPRSFCHEQYKLGIILYA